MCEILLREVHTFLREYGLPAFVGRVMSYRGGYTPEDRREIEKRMFRGDLLCMILFRSVAL